jgi:hypothetical protein
MRRIEIAELALVLVIALCACKPKAPPTQLEASQALASVLAEEAVKAAGQKRQIVIISPGSVWGSASTVETAFTLALKNRALSVAATKTVDVGDPMRSGPIGLKAADFLSVLEQFPDVGAVVSFAGAPLLKPGDSLKPEHPPVLVVATAMMGTTPGIPGDRLQLARLLESKVIRLAVVDASEPAPPSAGKTDATHDLFAQHYQILRQPE